jgi:hypothetical protein
MDFIFSRQIFIKHKHNMLLHEKSNSIKVQLEGRVAVLMHMSFEKTSITLCGLVGRIIYILFVSSHRLWYEIRVSSHSLHAHLLFF